MEEKTYNNLLVKYKTYNPDRHSRFIFRDIDFKRKKMINIGTGSGAQSVYGTKN